MSFKRDADVHWCVTVFYQQIENANIANQIHGFTIEYGKFILNSCYYMASSVSGQDEPNRAHVIGYQSVQDGAILPAWDYSPCPAKKESQNPNNKLFIVQAFSYKMAGYWPRSVFSAFMDLDSVSVHKHARKELGQYPAILTEKAWSITHT